MKGGMIVDQRRLGPAARNDLKVGIFDFDGEPERSRLLAPVLSRGELQE
jgi:hypothetical protein